MNENNKRLLSLLGLARRANRLSLGQRSRRGSAAEGPGAPGAAGRGPLSAHRGRVRFAAEEAGVDVLTAACTMDEISMALGKCEPELLQ